MSIRQLPDHVVGKIRSSIVITSLNGVVVGLLKNSLDAGATKVNITVDFTRGNCTVEDNGSGIPPSEFESSGGLAKPHHTSRFPPDEHVYGKHGDFLASLATVSLLLVSSCHRHHVSHNSLMIHNSKPITRHTPAPPEHRIQTFDHGTRILVRDLFGSMPVRVKHRAILFSERQNVDKHWSQLVHDIVAILISYPAGISLSLKDLTVQKELRLRSTDASDISIRASRIISQAFIPDSRDGGWIPISGSAGSMTLNGCISTRPAATRRCQFISLGIEPVDNTDDANIMYEEVNKVFKNSDFGVAMTENLDPRDPASAATQSNSRKGIERWPMFFFQLRSWSPGELPDADALFGNEHRDLKSILDLVKALGERTLGFSRGVPNIGRSSPFDGWHRIKVGHAVKGGVKEHQEDTPEPKIFGDNQVTPLISSGGRLLRKPFDEPETAPGCGDGVESNYFKDVPADGRSPYSSLQSELETPRNTSAENSNDESSRWLKGVLESWENPVFESAPTFIPRAYNDVPIQAREDGVLSKHFSRAGRADEIMLESSSISLAGRVSKLALQEAEIISQVDGKFILVKLPLENASGESRKLSSSALVVLDQHAVDERCQLESLMADFFVPSSQTCDVLEARTEMLDTPLLFEISKEEGRMLAQNVAYFSAWGINIDMEPNAGARTVDGGQDREASTFMAVTSLPPSIIARCRSEPRLIIDLLQGKLGSG
uniref:MutL C-terminal dimerisation domain-containing protein n=1 Tax=Bionectria ochroleuca TaxID=29856 RepID=A0A8H7NDX4_BIOOC